MGEVNGRRVAREGGYLDESDPSEVRGYHEETERIQREHFNKRMELYHQEQQAEVDWLKKTLQPTSPISDEQTTTAWVAVFHVAAAWGGVSLAYQYAHSQHLTDGWLWGASGAGAALGVAALWVFFYILKGCLYLVGGILLGTRRLVCFLLCPTLILLGIGLMGWGTSYSLCRLFAMCINLFQLGDR